MIFDLRFESAIGNRKLAKELFMGARARHEK